MADSDPAIRVNHFVRGKLVSGAAVRHRSRDLGADFTTPAIDLDALVTPRSEAPPLLDVKLAEIIDFLVETGERLKLERNPYLQESLERVVGHQSLAAPRGRESLPRCPPLSLPRGADEQHRVQFFQPRGS